MYDFWDTSVEVAFFLGVYGFLYSIDGIGLLVPQAFMVGHRKGCGIVIVWSREWTG
jgi:hypothetical protein